VPVTVRDARSSPQDREWIRKVYRDYLSELSASKTGLFPVLGEWDARENEFLAGWFADPGSHPFVILDGNHRAGFALVSRPPPFPRTPVEYRMAEFFVVSEARPRCCSTVLPATGRCSRTSTTARRCSSGAA
jgi:hypothetical protein